MNKIWLILLTVLITVICLFSYRSSYLQPFDYHYVKDLYDHSQWRIAQSHRGIGDDLIYQVAGYELWQKANYFEINPEMPPLGKYFYGLSIHVFNNAYYANIVFFILAILVFYQITKEFFLKQWQQATATLFFLMKPVFFTQLNTTLLDLPQLLSLLIHAYFIIKLQKTNNKQWLYASLAGLGLGAFISIKVGLLAGIILFVDLLFLREKRKWVYFLAILPITGLVYLLVYLPYFYQGNSIIDFIKAQLWILKFHTSSQININHFLLPISFFTGWYRGWSSDATWSRSEHWSLTWPIIGLFFLGTLMKQVRTLKIRQITAKNYLLILVGALFLVYMFIPFWTRYLLLVIPFMIILFVQRLMSQKSYWVLLVSLLLLIQLPTLLIRRPAKATEVMEKHWQRGFYQDLYSYLQFADPALSREQFWQQALRFEHQLMIRGKDVEINLDNHNFLADKITVQVKITYQTPLGPLKNIASTYLLREKNQWRLVWHNNLLLNNFTPKSRIETTVEYGWGGNLLTNNNLVLSTYELHPYFYITKNKIKNETALLQQLFTLTGLEIYEIENIYKTNSLDNIPMAIGFLKHELKLIDLQNIKLEPGLAYKLIGTRMVNSQGFVEKIDAINQLEQKYARQLDPVNGGTIVLLQKDILKTLSKKQSVNGQDVKLNPRESKIIFKH